MYNNSLTRGLSAIFVLVFSLVFGFSAIASYAPTISDSNRKVAKNQTYTIYWEEIKYGYDNTHYIDTLIIDENVLHGSLKTAGGQYVYPGLVIDAQNSGVAFYYTPDYGFQGADHFKWQATLDGYYSNISSFNFDVIYDYYPNHHGNSGHGHTESTNNHGGGSINYSDPVNSTNNFGGFGGGTGGGGDFLIIPTEFTNQPKPDLFRTGGFSL